MGLFGNKRIKVFGLDISDSAIKAMQLVRQGNDLVPVAAAASLLSEKVINNHIIVNEERLAQNIRRTIDLAKKIDTPYVVCSIPEAKSFVRVLTIPKMPESEIDGAVPFELEQDIPIPIDQVYLDWHLLREREDKLELLVTAAPKDYIDSLLQALKLAKLIPLAMELESQATARALIAGNDLEKIVLIVDMANSQTSFVVVDKGVIEYTSSVAVAGDAITESIARGLGMSKSDAEQVKRATGLASEAKESRVRASILPILDNVVDEIKNVIRFFEEHDAQHREIKDIILCGGSAHLFGVEDYLAARINLTSGQSDIRLELGNPWLKINSKDPNLSSRIKNEEAFSYTTAIGLALRDIDYRLRL